LMEQRLEEFLQRPVWRRASWTIQSVMERIQLFSVQRFRDKYLRRLKDVGGHTPFPTHNSSLITHNYITALAAYHPHSTIQTPFYIIPFSFYICHYATISFNFCLTLRAKVY
jgi:hypothetical protein